MRNLRLRHLGLVAVAGTLCVALWQLRGNQQAIARARAEAAQLTQQRDSLVTEVLEREQLRAALEIERETHDAAATRLRDSVTALERRRAAAQLTVREMRTVGALQSRLRATFPELGDSAWGLTTLPLHRGDTIGIEYLMLPAWFAETFVIDHDNAQSWRAQKDQLLVVDSLRLAVIALQDSITRLVAANAEAYEVGYRTAHTAYQDLSARYVAELKKPRFGLRPAVGILGAVGAGLLIGSVIR